MTAVHFYEKPGCINNSRQKKLLVDSGYALIVHDLLQEPWRDQPEKLRSFFGDRPVKDWFNPSAPAIKSGEIKPEQLSAGQAIELMLAAPILIRRPLLEVNGRRFSGFDTLQLQGLLNLDANNPATDLETCPKQPDAQACKP